MSERKEYEFVRNLPVAKFYYKGNHSHPIRRTVLVIESNSRFLRGYELREGAILRSYRSAPVKSYTRCKIARIAQCGRRLRRRTPAQLHGQLTLTRLPLKEYVKQGA